MQDNYTENLPFLYKNIPLKLMDKNTNIFIGNGVFSAVYLAHYQSKTWFLGEIIKYPHKVVGILFPKQKPHNIFVKAGGDK